MGVLPYTDPIPGSSLALLLQARTLIPLPYMFPSPAEHRMGSGGVLGVPRLPPHQAGKGTRWQLCGDGASEVLGGSGYQCKAIPTRNWYWCKAIPTRSPWGGTHQPVDALAQEGLSLSPAQPPSTLS